MKAIEQYFHGGNVNYAVQGVLMSKFVFDRVKYRQRSNSPPSDTEAARQTRQYLFSHSNVHFAVCGRISFTAVHGDIRTTLKHLPPS